MKSCPHCGKEIQDEAIKCRWCFKRLSADTDTNVKHQSSFQFSRRLIVLLSAGVVASLILAYSSWRYYQYVLPLQEGRQAIVELKKILGSSDDEVKISGSAAQRAVAAFTRVIGFKSSSAEARYGRAYARHVCMLHCDPDDSYRKLVLGAKEDESETYRKILSDINAAQQNDVQLSHDFEFLKIKVSTKGYLLSEQSIGLVVNEQDKADVKNLIAMRQDCRDLITNVLEALNYGMIELAEDVGFLSKRKECNLGDLDVDMPQAALIYSLIVYHLRVDDERSRDVYGECEIVRSMFNPIYSKLGNDEIMRILKLWGIDSLDINDAKKNGYSAARRKFSCALHPVVQVVDVFVLQKSGFSVPAADAIKIWERSEGIKTIFFSKGEYEKFKTNYDSTHKR